MGTAQPPVHQTEFLKFFLEGKSESGRTFIWLVRSYRGDFLGEIKWYGKWRQYCFYPNRATIFNNGCMKDIVQFIEDEMAKRRKKT